jgi:hypothetical protein
LPRALELRLKALQLAARENDLVGGFRRTAVQPAVQAEQQRTEDQEVQQRLTQQSTHRLAQGVYQIGAV